MSAQGSCTHVLRRTSQHEAHARMFFGVRVSTTLVHACSSTCKPARGTSRMQSGVLACTPEVPARREFERYAEESFWPAPTPGRRQESVVPMLFNFLVDNR